MKKNLLFGALCMALLGNVAYAQEVVNTNIEAEAKLTFEEYIKLKKQEDLTFEIVKNGDNIYSCNDPDVVYYIMQNYPEIIIGYFEGTVTYDNLYNFDKKSGLLTSIEKNNVGEELTIPEKIEGVEVKEIAAGCFLGCENLKKVYLPKTIENIRKEYAMNNYGMSTFVGCNNLEEIIVDTQNPNYYSKDGVLYKKDATNTLIYYPAKKANSDVLTIDENTLNVDAFALMECSNLKAIKITNPKTFLNDFYLNLKADKLDVYVPSGSDIEKVTYFNSNNSIDANIIAEILGDIDKDSVLTANDSAIILQKVLNLTDEDISALDYDKDGVLTANDSSSILQKILG